jgi:hypothetical protein
LLIFQGEGKNDYRQIKTTEKSSGNVTGKKMNTSVRHAMAMEPAENVLCSTNVAQQNRQGGTEKFFRKNNWRMDTVLPVNLIR